MKRYLISGIGPGPGGVGLLMVSLEPEYRSRGFDLITRRTSFSILRLLDRKKYFKIILEIINRSYDSIIFTCKCLCVFRSEIVVIHPQTIGYLLFSYLVVFNRVSLYVMDNSFFCIRSYNTHPLTNSECHECLSSINPHDLCYPSPVKVPKYFNLLFLIWLQKVSRRINFLAQNNKQAMLLKAHFGNGIRVSVVGMNAESSELPEKYNHPNNFSITQNICYDIVFHGATSAAKGIYYLLELAHLLPEFKFLIPDTYSNVKKMALTSLPFNVVCEEMNWETGLRDAVTCARLVINPSMWSAPIEGALVKSARFNKNVATVETLFGYESEITSIHNHIRLPSDTTNASKIIRKFLNSTD